jgi:lipoprotein-anchoring transpeptidase ErfK/SrfK
MRKYVLPVLLISVTPAFGQTDEAPMQLAQAGTDVVYARTVVPEERARKNGSFGTVTTQQRAPRDRSPQPDFADGRTQVQPGSMGGGFIEYLFTGQSAPRQALPRNYYQRPWEQMGNRDSGTFIQAPRGDIEPIQRVAAIPAKPQFDPRFMKQSVNYDTNEKPGSIVIDTDKKFLYFIEGEGKATRYGIGVGRPGFEWKGTKTVTDKKEWPDWRPPEEMLKRRPDLPTFMAGGPDNPMGARGIYLGSSLYRIHGSNEPHTIGQAVSSGCFRMRNDDVIDLYNKVKVGAKVTVM